MKTKVSLAALLAGALISSPLAAFDARGMTAEQIGARCDAEGGCSILSGTDLQGLVDAVVTESAHVCAQHLQRMQRQQQWRPA